MSDVECTNCGWQGNEEDLTLVEFNVNDDNETPTATEVTGSFVIRVSEEPKEIDFLKGCPSCLTDSCLTNID